MATLLLNNMFNIAVTTLNLLSPSLVTDILLHPFDFATVLLQIGFDPEGVKNESASFMTLIAQCALFTFYIPYLLTSMQDMQFMGMPNPGIFYYMNYIYKKEGLKGCYRGLIPKMCEKLIMLSVNDRVKRYVNKDLKRNASIEVQNIWNQDKVLQTLINGVCSQFFAVLASHPFHVLMVSSFAEFTYNKKSSMAELSLSIYKDDGYFGFFTGLTARLLGELLSLIFYITYTIIINKQENIQNVVIEPPAAPLPPKIPKVNQIVNCVTEVSRPHCSIIECNVIEGYKLEAAFIFSYPVLLFTQFKYNRLTTFGPKSAEDADDEETLVEENPEASPYVFHGRFSQIYKILLNFLRNITQNSLIERNHELHNRRRNVPLLECIPLTSRLFYYLIIRDYLSKKISTPFFLVCHCTIILNTGWNKFPFVIHLESLATFTQMHFTPSHKRIKKKFFNNKET